MAKKNLATHSHCKVYYILPTHTPYIYKERVESDAMIKAVDQQQQEPYQPHCFHTS